jgi:hypothetical protein
VAHDQERRLLREQHSARKIVRVSKDGKVSDFIRIGAGGFSGGSTSTARTSSGHRARRPRGWKASATWTTSARSWQTRPRDLEAAPQIDPRISPAARLSDLAVGPGDLVVADPDGKPPSAGPTRSGSWSTSVLSHRPRASRGTDGKWLLWRTTAWASPIDVQDGTVRCSTYRETPS